MPTRHPSRRFPTPALALAIGATLAATNARAASAAADASASVLDEIVVTATRHEETLSKVPISVTAMSQDMLDQKGIKDFQDIVRFTPGVSIDTTGTNAISIRGISSSAGSGTTGIYIDDTPIQMRALGFNPDDTLPKTFDLDRVEVLRGPQGTLFGSGSEGGTVRYIMNQPSLTTESTYARTELSFTQGGQANGEVGVAHGGPLIDDVLGYRASVWYRFDGGWIDRVDPATGAVVDRNANHANTIAARLAFVWKPADGVLVTPSLMYQNARKHDQSTYWPAYSNVADGVFHNGSPERYPVPDEYYLPALKIEADLGKTKLVSNTSYYYRDEQTAYLGTVYDLAYFQSLSWADTTGNCLTVYSYNNNCTTTQPSAPASWYPLINATGIHMPPGFAGFSTPNTINNSQRSWTQELRLQSNDAGSPLTWTVGAFWSLATEVSIEQLHDPNGQVIPLWQYLFGISPDSFYGPYYYCNGVGTPGLPIPNCDIYYNNNRSHDRQLAGFGEVSYNLTDTLKLTAGARYAKMSFDLLHFADGYENYGPTTTPASESETAFTPKLGLSWQATPNDLYYATYAKGFRPGGGNPGLPPFCSPGLVQEGYASGKAPTTYDSDSTQSFEVGAKNNFANRVKLASSLYYIKWNGIQQNVYVAGACGLQFTDNLGTAVAKGFDLQAEVAIGAGWSLEASFGYTSARYTENSPRAGLALAGDAISGEAAINYAPGTNPPWTLAVGPQYSFSVGDRDAFVRLDWEYSARNPWLAAVQDPRSAQYDPNSFTVPSTSFLSARGGLNLGRFQVSLFCDNLANTRTITSYAQVQIDANNPSYLANPNLPTSVQQNNYMFRPRTIGITASYKN